jgi:penicillin-binding protein 2
LKNKSITGRSKVRYNITTVIIYIVGIILLLQLFNLQIIRGEEYRNKSNTRLTRETEIQAARGSFLDRTGNIIANTKGAINLELYKTKTDDQTLNLAILNIINILEKNGDKYIDNFPININPFEYKFSSETRLANFRKSYKLKEDATAEEAFYELKNKYKIENDNIEDIRKILSIRYTIAENGYSSTRPIELAKNISNQSYNELGERSAEFPGLNMVIEPIRNYRLGSLGSHIIGHVGRISESELEKRTDQGYDQNDYIGKIGLEYIFEEYLRGENGVKQVDMSVNGTTTGEYISKEAVEGSNVVLTIDANLQRITENALKANIEKIRDGGFGKKYNAKGGAAVVMNVKTGEVLSLVSYPDFEPQLFVDGISTAKWEEYNKTKAIFNRAVQGAYAPGSIFKMVTAVAGLETQNVTKDEKINDTGVYPYGHNPVCWYWTSYRTGHGRINVSEAIKHSCNYFFYETIYRMGIEQLEKYANFFRLGQKTGIELPGEISGVLAGKTNYQKQGKTWYLGDSLSAAIGQGENNFSPIQIARYISILTNGQKVIKPTLIKSIINPDGTQVPKEEIEEFVNQKLGIQEETQEEISIQKENIEAVLQGMQSVTTETGGTAYSIFKNFNIEVGGKTGSTESNTGDVNAWFTGFAPYNNPEIAVVILVENGGHGYYTAEVARDIIAEYFGMNMSGVVEDMTAISPIEKMR